MSGYQPETPVLARRGPSWPVGLPGELVEFVRMESVKSGEPGQYSHGGVRTAHRPAVRFTPTSKNPTFRSPLPNGGPYGAW